MVSWAFHGPMVAGDALRDSLTSLDCCPAGFSDLQPCFTASPVQLGRDARESIFELPAIVIDARVVFEVPSFQKYVAFTVLSTTGSQTEKLSNFCGNWSLYNHQAMFHYQALRP
ncbi:hypothetical protein T11_12853 [Trichinella zimbabwensis]|uniref:Uncharacterized protein n=1 Tax=Trichinella zimbabwensis TaxID=268475 RepID=A0A0V1HTL6_9BILA|nr:hypothetical protein T11_12853 [Trichinella zimbabwensis]